MPGKQGNDEKRRENREVAYLPEKLADRFSKFHKEYPVLGTKSQILARALEFYVDQIEAEGFDAHGFPNAPQKTARDKIPRRSSR